MDWQQLREVFNIAGEVRHTDIQMDSRGKSKGSATVTFDTILDAVNAICIL